MNLKSEMDKFAQVLIAKASQDNTPLLERIDAFKAVTAYYAAQQKKRKNQDEEEPDSGGFNFAGSDEVVNGSGNKAVHSRRSS